MVSRLQLVKKPTEKYQCSYLVSIVLFFNEAGQSRLRNNSVSCWYDTIR